MRDSRRVSRLSVHVHAKNPEAGRRTPTRNQSKTANAHLWSIHPPVLHNLINQVEPELQEKAKAMKPVPQVFYYNKGL